MECDENPASSPALILQLPLLQNTSHLPTFAAVIVADMLDGVPDDLLVVNIGLEIYNCVSNRMVRSCIRK